MDQDLNCISAFAKVAQYGSFRKAAKSLNTPVSTISNRVARLENSLKVKLLDRSTRTVRLTEVGQNYLQSVTPALSTLSSAANHAQENKKEPRGLLKVSVPIELGVRYIPSAIAEFKKSCPQVKVDCHLSNRRIKVLEEGFDVAIRAGYLDDSSLVCRGVGAPQILMTCVSPAYLAQHGQPHTPAELSDHDCLLMSGSREPDRWLYMVNDNIEATKVNSSVLVNNYSVLIELGKKSIGVINAPLFMVTPFIATGELIQVLTDFTLPPMQMHALYPQSGRTSTKLQLFLDALDNSIVN